MEFGVICKYYIVSNVRHILMAEAGDMVPSARVCRLEARGRRSPDGLDRESRLLCVWAAAIESFVNVIVQLNRSPAKKTLSSTLTCTFIRCCAASLNFFI